MKYYMRRWKEKSIENEIDNVEQHVASNDEETFQKKQCRHKESMQKQLYRIHEIVTNRHVQVQTSDNEDNNNFKLQLNICCCFDVVFV